MNKRIKFTIEFCRGLVPPMLMLASVQLMASGVKGFDLFTAIVMLAAGTISLMAVLNEIKEHDKLRREAMEDE